MRRADALESYHDKHCSSGTVMIDIHRKGYDLEEANEVIGKRPDRKSKSMMVTFLIMDPLNKWQKNTVRMYSKITP